MTIRYSVHARIRDAVVTGTGDHLIDNVRIDALLLERTGIKPGEVVLIESAGTGACWETMVLAGERGCGELSLNGPSEPPIKAGEAVVITAFNLQQRPGRRPVEVRVNANNIPL